jgi:hypothetical protein
MLTLGCSTFGSSLLGNLESFGFRVDPLKEGFSEVEEIFGVLFGEGDLMDTIVAVLSNASRKLL